MDWFDVAIVLVLAIYAYRGWRRGFVSMALGLGVLAVSLAFAALVYKPVGSAFHSLLPDYAGRAIAFLVIWFGLTVGGSVLASRWYKQLPESTVKSQGNRIAGIAPGIVEGLILIAFFSLLFVSLPGDRPIRHSVEGSFLARPLVSQAATVEKMAAEVFGEALRGFVTVRPEIDSHDVIDLHYKTTDVKVDEQAEQTMLALVNTERTSRGLKPLMMDQTLRDVARAHCRDMFANGYFSHVNLRGESPFKRMKRNGIHYSIAGENLALAPTVDIGHEGLMHSPGHRANILAPEFRRIGIGAVSSEVRGIMFGQEFAD